MDDLKAQTSDARFAPIFAPQVNTSKLSAIYRDVYGDEYPGDADPFGFITVSDLAVMADAVSAATGGTLLDIGCGKGGPGRWIAGRIGADLLGFDIVEDAIEAASRRTALERVGFRAEYQVANVVSTGLPRESFDGAVSVDVLSIVADKSAAFREIARLLKRGAALAFSTWEPEYLRYEWFLEPAGFDEVVRLEVPGAKDRQLAVYETILQCRDEIVSEMGAAAAEIVLEEARTAPAMLVRAARRIFVARRWDGP